MYLNSCQYLLMSIDNAIGTKGNNDQIWLNDDKCHNNLIEFAFP